MTKIHSLSLRVYYEDTDAGGIVYYANYLRFLERGRTEWLRMAGFDHAQLRHNYGLGFAVRECRLTYHAPARLDDCVTVTTALNALGAAKLDMRQRIRHEERLLLDAEVQLVTLDAAGKPLRLPDMLRAAVNELIVNEG